MVEKNVPGAEAVIKVALQEEPPFQGITKSVNAQIDSIKSTFTSVSDTVSSASNKVTGLFGGKKDPPVQAASKPNETAVQKTDKLKSAATPPQPAAQKETKIVTKSDVSPPPPKPAAPQPQPLPHEVVELEKAIELSAQLAIKEYNSAIGVLKWCVFINKYLYLYINYTIIKYLQQFQR